MVKNHTQPTFDDYSLQLVIYRVFHKNVNYFQTAWNLNNSPQNPETLHACREWLGVLFDVTQTNTDHCLVAMVTNFYFKKIILNQNAVHVTRCTLQFLCFTLFKRPFFKEYIIVINILYLIRNTEESGKPCKWNKVCKCRILSIQLAFCHNVIFIKKSCHGN